MTGHTQDIVFALLVFIPLTLWIGSKIGEGIPFLLAILTAAILALTIPPKHWNAWVFLTPFGVAIFSGMALDHRRRAFRHGRRP